MSKQTYSEKLKDPRWQRKRLEILNRSNFTCEDCGAADKTLHVHHCLYESGKEPWEYDANVLRALCDDCHESRAIMEKECVYEFRHFLATQKRDALFHIAQGFCCLIAYGDQETKAAELVEWLRVYGESFEDPNL